MVGSSTIIHDLQQCCYIRADDEHGDILIYHYFSHTEEFLQLLEPMLRSCIAQGCFRGSVKTLLVEYCARYNATFMSEDPSLDELTAFLSMLLKTPSGPEQVEDARPGGNAPQRQIFLILDALDEVPFGNQRDEVLKFIQTIRDLHRPNIYLLVTSRAGAAEKDIANVLDQASTEPEADLGNHSDDGENAFHNDIASKSKFLWALKLSDLTALSHSNRDAKCHLFAKCMIRRLKMKYSAR